MSIKVNKDTCIGCGACASLCPDVFRMTGDGKSEVVPHGDGNPITENDVNCARNAAGSCPVQAITVD